MAVGTTNLKTRGARVGVPYLSVLHLMLAQTSRAAASEIARTAPVAGAHSYWTGDAAGADEWERTPTSAHGRSTTVGALARTNHCLVPENIARETDLSPSTHARYDRVVATLGASSTHDLASLKALFADRSDGPQSINRFAEDHSGATTNAVVVCDPAHRAFWACRGQSDRGEWAELPFDRPACA